MPEYTIAFEKGTPIWELYQGLKKDGVNDSDIDTGYPETDYVKKERRIIHNGDHEIEEAEVLDYALDRYEKYQSLIKGTTGYVVHWSLDDMDPATTFDVGIRQKAGDAITRFKEILVSKGYKDRRDEYNEPLAVALYAFAMTPQRKSVSILKTEVPDDIRKELEKLGLQEVIGYPERQHG